MKAFRLQSIRNSGRELRDFKVIFNTLCPKGSDGLNEQGCLPRVPYSTELLSHVERLAWEIAHVSRCILTGQQGRSINTNKVSAMLL